jgi:hypothetical protein
MLEDSFSRDMDTLKKNSSARVNKLPEKYGESLISSAIWLKKRVP